MKRLILGTLIATALAIPAAAENVGGQLGVGAMLGSPTGVTAKYWVDDMLAIDGGIGYGNAAVFYADALVNDWRLLPAIQNASTNLYAGVGPRVATDDGGQFALRAMVGAGFWPKQAPIELFAEIGPTFKLTPDNRVGVDGGVGLRYYFKVALSPAR